MLKLVLITLPLFFVSCAHSKKNEEKGTNIIPLPTPYSTLVHGSQRISREIMTHRVLSFSIAENNCINTLRLSQYELVIEELSENDSKQIVHRQQLEKREFSLRLTMYSDHRYRAKLVDFNSQRVMVDKALARNSDVIFLTPSCDKVNPSK